MPEGRPAGTASTHVNLRQQVEPMSFLSRLFGQSEPHTQGVATSQGTHPEAGLPVDAAPDDLVDGTLPPGPLLDVRTPGEFQAGRVRGATLMNMMSPDFLASVDALGLDRQAPVYLYCRTGNRSGQAARALRNAGYAQAVNVGGLDQLLTAGAVGEAD